MSEKYLFLVNNCSKKVYVHFKQGCECILSEVQNIFVQHLFVSVEGFHILANLKSNLVMGDPFLCMVFSKPRMLDCR